MNHYCHEEADETWKKRFQELTQYFDENGHSLVPQHYSHNKKLGSWVAAQRKYRRMLKTHKSSKQHGRCNMTVWKIKQLERLNFCWYVGKGGQHRDRIIKKLLKNYSTTSTTSTTTTTTTSSSLLNDKDLELARLIATFPKRKQEENIKFSNLLLAAAASNSTTRNSTCLQQQEQCLTTITQLQQEIAKLQQETTKTQMEMEEIQQQLVAKEKFTAEGVVLACGKRAHREEPA